MSVLNEMTKRHMDYYIFSRFFIAIAYMCSFLWHSFTKLIAVFYNLRYHHELDSCKCNKKYMIYI